MDREIQLLVPESVLTGAGWAVRWKSEQTSCVVLSQDKSETILLVRTATPCRVNWGPGPASSTHLFVLLERKERNVIWPAGENETVARDKWQLCLKQPELFDTYARYSKQWIWWSPISAKLRDIPAPTDTRVCAVCQQEIGELPAMVLPSLLTTHGCLEEKVK